MCAFLVLELHVASSEPPLHVSPTPQSGGASVRPTDDITMAEPDDVSKPNVVPNPVGNQPPDDSTPDSSLSSTASPGSQGRKPSFSQIILIFNSLTLVHVCCRD